MGSDALYSNRGKGCGIISSDVTKRALSAGFGVGALALLAPRASADTPFSSFAFPATGAPTARTMPDRLAEIKSVKDFGAKGDGVTDDTAALQAMFNQFMAGTLTGKMYFSPGTYLITSPLTLNEINKNFGLHVSGNAATLLGYFPGYLIERNTTSGNDNATFITIEGLALINNNQAAGGGGCVHLTHGFQFHVKDCYLRGYIGVSMTNVLQGSVRRCMVRGIGSSQTDPASIGIFMWCNQAHLDQIDINGLHHGVRAMANLCMRETRIEQCMVGTVIGMTADGGTWDASGEISNSTFEANQTAIWAYAASHMRIHSCGLLGDPFGPVSGVLSDIGLRVTGMINCVVGPLDSSGTYTDAAILFDPNVVINQSVWMSVNGLVGAGGGVNWKGLPASHPGLTLLQCNNA